MHIPYFNYQIYESDIITAGGSVEYFDEISVTRRSALKNAHVYLGNISVNCRMEVFRDGTSVIRSFLQNGKPKGGNLFPEAKELISSFYERLEMLPEVTAAKVVKRTFMQYVLAIFQFLFFLLFALNMHKFFTHGSLAFVAALLASACMVFIFIIGRFYTKVRVRYICRESNSHAECFLSKKSTEN